jgi:hypothetical protein
MANISKSLVAGTAPADNKKSKAGRYFSMAGKAALVLTTAAAMTAQATELLLKKGQAFSTKNNTTLSPDSLLAKNGNGKYGALLTITPSGGTSSKIPIREGDSMFVDNTKVKLLSVTVGVRTIWFGFDTTTTTAVGPDTSFTLGQGQSKDTLGTSITATDFARVPNQNGSYDAILTVRTVRGVSIVQIGPGETKRVAVGATPGQAVDIKAIKTASTFSASSVELQATAVNTVKAATNSAPLSAYGYTISVTGIGQKVDSSGTTSYVAATVKAPNGTSLSEQLIINKPVSIVDTSTGAGIAITAKDASQVGTSVSANLAVEQIQNASVFTLGQPVTLDTSFGTMKLVDAHDSVAVFNVNGDTVQVTVGKEATLTGHNNKTLKITVTDLAVGKNSAFATTSIKYSGQTNALNPSKGLFTAHQDRIVLLSNNRYGLVFAKPGRHTASVYGISGRLVASLPFNGNRGIVDLSALPAGRYVISTEGMNALGQSIQY